MALSTAFLLVQCLLTIIVPVSSFIAPVPPVVEHHLSSRCPNKPIRSSSRTIFALWFAARRNSNNENKNKVVGRGPNWIERSFAVDTTEGEKINPKQVIDYDLGLDGASWDTGPLSARMYDAMTERSSLDVAGDAEIQRALKIYALDFTAKEAVRAALKQNGLEMVLTEDEQDEGLWGDVDSIRLANEEESVNESIIYDSWEEAVEDWTPGQSFSFVVRQVPAKMAELSLEQLLQALDPDGKLRAQADAAGMALPIEDEDIVSLQQMAQENRRRCDRAPRDGDDDDETGTDSTTAAVPYEGTDAAGYRVLAAQDLAPRQRCFHTRTK